MMPDHEIITGLQRHRQGLAANIGIEPFSADRLQPASYDVTLDSRFLVPSSIASMVPIDPLNAATGSDMHEQAIRDGTFILPAHSFALASTVETFVIPADVVARIEGRSSLARLGLAVHITAGFVDPGFTGQLTLELFNFRARPFRLTPGMSIAQVSFERMTSAAVRPYGSAGLGSKYVDQNGPVASKGVCR